MEHKKYQDIQVAREDNIGAFDVGDFIVIQTKVDGANAAIRYDAENDSLVAQSRKRILGVGTDGLRGFFDYVQGLDKDKFKEVLGENLILFGEWNVPHTVKYLPEYTNKFFAFDVYDTKTGSYLTQQEVCRIAYALDIEMVKTLYAGPFISWSHVKSFLTESCYGETIEEGIVCKNQTRLLSDSTGGYVYLKIVNEQFKETKRERTPKPEQTEKYNYNLAKTGEIVTLRRVEKAIQKAQDYGELPLDLSIEQMGLVCRIIPKMVFEDCIKEEPEAVKQIEEFSKFCSKVTMNHARSLLTKENV